MSEEKRKILEMVESGRITAEEAARLLDLVDEEPSSIAQAAETEPVVEGAAGSADEPRVRPYWRQALFGGAVVMIVAGAVLADAYQRSGVTVWTWVFGWIPLFLGLAIVTVASWARTARWVQMHFEGGDEQASLSFPLPLGPGASIIAMLRPLVPQMQRDGMDQLILALREGLPDDEPVAIEIDNQEKGEYVRILID